MLRKRFVADSEFKKKLKKEGAETNFSNSKEKSTYWYDAYYKIGEGNIKGVKNK